MQLPFSTDEFFGVFREYNISVWPAQLGLQLLGVAIVLLLFVRKPQASVAISAILALLWAWTGLVYHLVFFARINPLAYGFAGWSVMGAGILFWQGVVRGRLQMRWNPGIIGAGGLGLMLFALVGYPAWTYLAGHRYPEFPTFGLPCPLALLTIGVLGSAAPAGSRWPLLVPLGWCFIGAQAAFLFGLSADYALVVAGGFGIGLMVRRNRVANLEREGRG